MKKLTLLMIALLSTQANASNHEMTTLLKIAAWSSSAPGWEVTGNHSCIHNISYKSSSETKWANIGTANEPPRYVFEVTHSPRCNATVTFHWGDSPNNSNSHPDSFARVEMSQYY